MIGTEVEQSGVFLLLATSSPHLMPRQKCQTETVQLRKIPATPEGSIWFCDRYTIYKNNFQLIERCTTGVAAAVCQKQNWLCQGDL